MSEFATRCETLTVERSDADKPYPAKHVLDNTDEILDAIFAQLRNIEEAIFGEATVQSLSENKDTCMLDTLNRQNLHVRTLKNVAEHILSGLM